jgi:glycosyltransferase involved in cell wall biosynthesis
LSVVIIAQNEERTIGQVIQAVRELAREVILVDSGSTDGTKEIAAQLGARVVHQDWLGYSAQKNFAIGMASSDWILSLDADEVLTPNLVSEIRNSIGRSTMTGYKIPRILYIGQTAYRKGGFYPDAQLRLFRRGGGRFVERIIHESMSVDGAVAVLKHPMLHYAYPDTAEFASTMDKYARLSAQHYFDKGSTGWRASYLNELIHPIWTFFYRFIIRAGFLEGRRNLKLNLIYADYVRKKISYLRALKGRSKA